MRQVAERAGVSSATVSYVVNGRETAMRISPETRERILSAVKELGYYPNALARGLSNKGTHSIAVVMQYSSLFSGCSGFTNELMHGVTTAAVEHGFNLMLQTREPDTEWSGGKMTRIEAEVAALTDGRVDGALLLRDVDDPLALALRERDFPAVMMFSHSRDAKQWFVDCDNVLGGKMATEYLIALGHRRIAHLCGSQRSGASIERMQGFFLAMEQAGLQANPDWVFEGGYSSDEFERTKQIFRLPKSLRPTAVFVWSDDVAFQLMSVLRGIGLQIPQDVSIIGFDSTEICEHTDPPLTSVRQPILEMASLAFKSLSAQLRKESVSEIQIRAEPTLILRKSCASPSS